MLTLTAYLPVARSGFVWDDDDYVTENRMLRSGDGLARIWLEPGAVPQYYPLVHTMFWLEYRLWELDPLGYHLVNVVLHALGACLLWRLLVRLEIPGAWLAAGIFALHPVHVESVSWVTERKNVLAGVFYFLSFLVYLRFHPTGQDRPNRPWSRWVLATALYLCALLCKTVSCSLPAAILLVRWFRRGRLRVADALPLVPWFALGIGFAGITVWLERYHVGAQGAPWELSWVERILVAGRALWFYTWKLVWPVNLSFNYPRWTIDPTVAWQWIFPTAAWALVVALWALRSRIGRGPVTTALFFGGTLVPALGVFDVYPMRYSFVADHFQYLASVGPLALAGAGVARVAGWSGPRWIAPTAASALLLILAALTWSQAHVYRDAESLWKDTLAKNPGSSVAHNNLGVLLKKKGAVDEAVAHYREALRVDPHNYEAANNLGNALQSRGRSDEAITLYGQALRDKPDYASALNGLGIAFAERGEFARAEESYRRALRIRPGMTAAHFNLANALARQGRLSEAIAAYREALAGEPDLAMAHLNLGRALLQSGLREEALGSFREALRLEPGLLPARQAIDEIRRSAPPQALSPIAKP